VLKKGTEVPNDGYLYSLEKGLIDAKYRRKGSSREFILYQQHKGLIGLDQIAGETQRFRYVARTNSIVKSFGLISSFPIDLEAAIFLARQSQLAKQRLTDFLTLDTETRVMKILTDKCFSPLAITHPDGFQIGITRQDLAKLASLSRERTGIVIKGLHKKGLIYLDGRKQHIVLLCDREEMALRKSPIHEYLT
jgi:CRP-like cAMP-binding protein